MSRSPAVPPAFAIPGRPGVARFHSALTGGPGPVRRPLAGGSRADRPPGLQPRLAADPALWDRSWRSGRPVRCVGRMIAQAIGAPGQSGAHAFGGWMVKRRILAIDGGGVRGIIPAVLLARLEAVTGRPARETFDFVAGTSTGAVIAGAL